MNSSKYQVELHSPVDKPNACGFLWNKKMMLSMNCQGYANAQFMQPEPSKYAFSPSLEAKTFMQPEHPYFAHHPGRFFYLKNEQTKEVFSLPFAPCKIIPTHYRFIMKSNAVIWEVKHAGLDIVLSLSLVGDEALEKWSIDIKKRDLSCVDSWSLYAYFPLGYMSWMNQSADYDVNNKALVATYVTPYQKLEEYPRLKNTAQKTFLSSSKECTSWCASQNTFEGLGGLRKPDAVFVDELPQSAAIYETPCACIQHRVSLKSDSVESIEYLFGAIHQNNEIEKLRKRFFNKESAKQVLTKPESNFGSLKLSSPDAEFDRFINHWLPRQVQYHYEVNRLTTDPQTRNYIQDNIGACFIEPYTAKECLRKSLSQQHFSGEMPDGILLHPDAELKYINQIPHSDHCVWLPLLLHVYLNQTNDIEFLQESLGFQDSDECASVFEHIEKALQYLLNRRDKRGLCFIDQGDWCDPMNMVGAKGKGVSTWLTLASSYAIQVWQSIERDYSKINSEKNWGAWVDELNHAVNKYCWDEQWYNRGITDDGDSFGVSSDKEGRIYLNPQSWSLLSNAANEQQKLALLKSVTQHLQTPYGNMMLAPSYSTMHEHIGRLTQKHIGCAENGSVYNHAFVFWIFALFESDRYEEGFLCIQEMVDACQSEESGQLPVYVPNYFRGAFYQAPEVAGKSSHLFNTGTAAWLYRIVIEKLCGFQGNKDALLISPHLPKAWNHLNAKYRFRGATVSLMVKRTELGTSTMRVNQNIQREFIVKNIAAGQHYDIEISLAKEETVKQPTLTLVMGVSGSGKTSLAESIAKTTGALFIDGDDLHSQKSKQKMARGIALTDTDRQPWIERIVRCLKQKLLHGYDVVFAFSGLKQAHRRALNKELSQYCSNINNLFLDADFTTLEERLASRTEHFFQSSLLKSQFQALERPSESEVVFIDANKPNDGVLSQALDVIDKELKK